jgi:hypothetical protein
MIGKHPAGRYRRFCQWSTGSEVNSLLRDTFPAEVLEYVHLAVRARTPREPGGIARRSVNHSQPETV